MAEWATEIPGTDINRLEFLHRLQYIANDQASTFPLYRNEYIRELAKTNVLNPPQIGAVVGCSGVTVRTVLGSQRPTETVVGVLDPAALPVMILCAHRLARGTHPEPELMEALTEKVSAVLLSKLVGYSQPTWWRASQRRRAQVS